MAPMCRMGTPQASQKSRPQRAASSKAWASRASSRCTELEQLGQR